MRVGGFCFERKTDPEEYERVFYEMDFDSIGEDDYMGDETVLHISFCLHDDETNESFEYGDDDDE
jgi:hypothetical protein